MFFVAEYHEPFTFRGSFGHHTCPYRLRIHPTIESATQDLIQRAVESDRNTRYENGSLTWGGNVLWRRGDPVIHLDEKRICIQHLESFRKSANLVPDKKHRRMGAFTQSDLETELESFHNQNKLSWENQF